jgi:hypothetical protein
MIIALATGSGRCGTQTFGAQMQRLKGVIGVHEGVHMAYMGARKSHNSPHLSCGDPTALNPNLAALRDRRDWAYHHHEKNDIRAYGEAAHYFGLNMELVEQVFPEARIVHIVRDPVAMVWSMLQHARHDIYENGKHRRSAGGWTWWGDCFPLFPGVVDRASGFAMYWEMVNRAISRTTLPRLLVRTENLRKPETWEEILEFIGLDAEVEAPRLVFNAIHRSKKIHGQVPPKIVQTVRGLCKWQPE